MTRRRTPRGIARFFADEAACSFDHCHSSGLPRLLATGLYYLVNPTRREVAKNPGSSIISEGSKQKRPYLNVWRAFRLTRRATTDASRFNAGGLQSLTGACNNSARPPLRRSTTVEARPSRVFR
jgi:hypothetical protein